jgi:thiol-disulfide isomerase/thioredoxin
MRTCSVLLLCFSLLAGCSPDHSRISGTLLGADGKPMPLAHVQLTYLTHNQIIDEYVMQSKPFVRVQVDSSGNFELPSPDRGAFSLLLWGVGHRRLEVPLLLNKPTDVSLHVRLGAISISANAMGADIGFNLEKKLWGERLRLAKQPDGLLKGELHGVDSVIRYRFEGCVPMDPMECLGVTLLGTSAERYELMPDGRYSAVQRVKDSSVSIRFDPTVAAQLTQQADWSFADSTSVQARFVRRLFRFRDWMAEMDKGEITHIAQGQESRTFSWPWKAKADQITDELQREPHGEVRSELIVELLQAAVYDRSAVDEANLRRWVKEVEPTSLVWAFHGSLALKAVTFHPSGMAYLDEMVEKSPSMPFRGYLLHCLANEARSKADTATYEKLRERLNNEFAQVEVGQDALGRLRPQIVAGKSLPAFSLPSLDDPSITLTNETFKGKYLLIDFWGTTCPPCVGQMKELQEIYETYHTKGLEILSIALDQSPQYVTHFRKTKWAMPWNNSVIPSEQRKSIDYRFEVTLPKNIIVDPKGTTLFVSDGAAENLKETLASILERRQ